MKAAEFLKDRLSGGGVITKIHNTSGSPVVTGLLDVGVLMVRRCP